MRNHITVEQVRLATLAVDRGHLRELSRCMVPESFAFLCQRMFVEPLAPVLLDNECLVVNKPGVDNSALLDLLQLVIGPVKIGRPIRCWIREAGANPADWRPISLEKRVVARNVREFHVT